MKKVGFLGCGKIGKHMLSDLLEGGIHKVTFVQDPFYEAEDIPYVITKKAEEELLEETDLVIECAMASVLKENFDAIIKHCDLMVFSVTAFADEAFYQHAKELASKYKNLFIFLMGQFWG